MAFFHHIFTLKCSPNRSGEEKMPNNFLRETKKNNKKKNKKKNKKRRKNSAFSSSSSSSEESSRVRERERERAFVELSFLGF